MKTITTKSINKLVAIIKYAYMNNIKNFNVVLSTKQTKNPIKTLLNCYFTIDENNNIVALDCYLLPDENMESITAHHFIIPINLSYSKVKEVLINNLSAFKNTDFFDGPVICSYNDLYQLCCDNMWFTQGDNSQYQKLFAINSFATNTSEDFSFENFSLEQIASIIWFCSDNSKWSYEHILSELNTQYNKYLDFIIDSFTHDEL